MRAVIVGGGKVGSHLARTLSADNHEVTLVEINPERCTALEGTLGDVKLVCGDGDEPYVLDDANASRRHAIVFAAEGSFGSPGIVITSPQTITTNSAPAASRTSRTLTTWPDGAPRSSGSVENEYCVFATQTG